MKKSTLRATAAWQALALLGAGVPAAFIAATPAAAQDYTAGAVTGTVTTEAGAPVSGATVVMTSKSQGFTRTATTTAGGNFSFSGLPGGYYDVTVASSGSVPFRATDVTVLAGQASDLTIQLTAATEGVDADEIVVVGSRIQAFTGTTTGLNVNVEELTKAVPLGRSLTDIILLAPGTTQGDSAFGNLASIGGSSVAENAYYVNGLNITNFDNYLGSSNVPFDMYKSVEVKSGGYPAEFGRATGGIVNAVTKSGTNDFMAALHLNWSPDFLRGTSNDIETCSYNDSLNPAAGSTCRLATNRGFDESDSYSAIMEAGGPLIRDRLFAYGLLEVGKSEYTIADVVGGVARNGVNDSPFWGLKFDAYPIDDHHLEFTIYDNRSTTRVNYLGYSEVGGVGTTGLASSVEDFNGGGVSYVGKYTGRFTDWLTLSAAYGRMQDRFDNVGVAGDASLPFVRHYGGTFTASTGETVRNGDYLNGQRVASTSLPYDTERKFFRADADMYFSAFGEHHIRLGFDREENTLEKASVRTGGQYLLDNGFITPEAFNAGYGNAGFIYQLLNSFIFQINYFNSSGQFEGINQAYYIQDEWDVTDRLTLSLGLRRDDFRVDKADGSDYVSQKENYAPRLGLTYDLFDDKRGTFKAFYGQYFLPFASNTAFRQVGSEIYIRERFTYDGFDGDGIPIVTGQWTGSSTYQGTCPFALSTYTSTGQHCNVTGNGDVADSTALIDANLKATKESEWIVGYEHKLGAWRLGVNYTNRRLDRTAEDVAIDAAVLAYCDANGITGCSSTWTGFHQYVITNPGSDMSVTLDAYNPDLDGRRVTLSAADLQYPKPVRKYDAVEFTMARPFDGVWTAGGSYTWSKSRGNSEGFVQSDFGQDDAGITQDFDQPGFTDGAYGPLPNDRRHRIKAWGSYRFMDALTLGTNISIASPRPLSCFGYHPTDPFANAYGAASHYCGGVLAPRGEGSETDWLTQVDFKAAYDIKMPTGQLMTIRADVFNLFNSQAVVNRNETGEIDNGVDYIPNVNYDRITQYQAPRAVRLGLDISF